jgi:hypothetical protein
MHVDTICPGCQRKLRVPAEHAGQTARCPVCNAIYTVPDAAAQPVDPQDRWRLATPEGQEYGPVAKSVLDGWVAEGRVSDDCRLICEADGVWRGADDVYPVLRPAPVAVPVAEWNNALDPLADAKPFQQMPINSRGYIVNTSRGGIVLALGILSWALCFPIFGIVAWAMGNNDLNEMQQGTMDNRGQVMTEAGRMIGMLHALSSLATLVISIFLALFWLFFR